MANGLETLLRLRQQPGSAGQIPAAASEEGQLGALIPDEELYGAQDAYAQAGRESGMPFAVPSREALRGSGVSALRRMFSQTAAEGEAAARPQEVAGQYGLERERITQRGGIEKAALEESAAAARAELGHSRSLERQGMLQEAITGRTAMTQDAIGGRSAASQAAIGGRQQASDLLRRATALEKQAQQAYDLFGFGSRRQLQQEADALRQQAQAALAGDGGGDVAGGGGDVIELDLSPEQLANLQSMLGQ